MGEGVLCNSWKEWTSMKTIGCCYVVVCMCVHELSSLFAEEHLGIRVKLVLTLVMGQKCG